MSESNSDRSVLRVAFLAKQLNKAITRFRDPIDTDTVLADFARSVDSFLSSTSRAGLSREKQDAVLASVHRLLGAERSSIRYSDRFIIACQILAHCARPETVTCGAYATSAAAALEHLLYVSEPQVVASLVCDVAISGQWRSPAGNVVAANRLNLLPVILPIVIFEDGGDGLEGTSASMATDVSVHPRGVDRSYASHLAQLVLTNEMLSGMPGNFRYVVMKYAASLAGLSDFETDVVEALFSNGKFVERFAGISLSHVRRTAEALAGRDVLLAVRDEVQLFDTLTGNASVPLLAVLGTVNGGVEWQVIRSFTAREGKLCTFNPRESGRNHVLGLSQLAKRLR
jgi:hypothetical protein